MKARAGGGGWWLPEIQNIARDDREGLSLGTWRQSEEGGDGCHLDAFWENLCGTPALITIISRVCVFALYKYACVDLLCAVRQRLVHVSVYANVIFLLWVLSIYPIKVFMCVSALRACFGALPLLLLFAVFFLTRQHQGQQAVSPEWMSGISTDTSVIHNNSMVSWLWDRHMKCLFTGQPLIFRFKVSEGEESKRDERKHGNDVFWNFPQMGNK